MQLSSNLPNPASAWILWQPFLCKAGRICIHSYPRSRMRAEHLQSCAKLGPWAVEMAQEKIMERKSERENQGPAGNRAWHGCSETISAVMYTDRVCHSLKSSREKKGHSCLSCCQGDIIGECFGKTTAGKGKKLQPEAQICESLSECNAGIACKEHTLESVKSDTNSPQLFLWLWG